MIVTLSWSVDLGEIDYVAAFDFDDGSHLGMITFSDRGEVTPGSVPVEITRPLASAYLAKPWMFLLDGESGQRKQTLCLCHIR